jgi:hypothetical protein
MDSKRLTWLAAVLAVVAAMAIMGCRKSPPGKGATATSAKKALAIGANNARMWLPPLAGMGVGSSGIPWATGRIYAPFDFGSGMVSPTKSNDIYLARLDPATCQASATFTFGGAGGKDRRAGGVAVAANGNVGLIGSFSGEINFTGRNAEGSGPDGKPGIAGLDYLKSGRPAPFFGVFDGNSKGTHITPIKTHVVSVGFGALLSVGSNPGQDAFALCGKTDKAVPSWSDSGETMGVITDSKAVAGGGMDIVVAKIDATTGAVVWGKQFGGAGNQGCDSATLDNNGDVIIAGGYSGTLSFGSIALPTVANQELALIYVARLNGATGEPIAARTWGKGGRSNAYGLTVDSSNNIVVAGVLGGSIDFGGGISIVNNGWTDAFVAKLTPELALAWAKSFGDADFDQGVNSVGVSSKGDVFIGGSFQGGLGMLGLTSASNTAPDAFTAELAAADGAVLSAHAYGDAAGEQAISTVTVARAATGRLANSTFVGGSFWSTITFGSTTLKTDSRRALVGFVARLAP